MNGHCNHLALKFSVCVKERQDSYFPFGFEGGIWDLIVSVPDHLSSFLLFYDVLVT